MPPIVRFSREAVLNAAYQLVRREGPAALNARAVAKELGGSTQPIFRLFSGMEELKQAVIELTLQTWKTSLSQRLQESAFPYLTIGMSFLLFARDEPELFKLLFMRDRVSDGSCTDYNVNWGIPLIEDTVKVDVKTARMLYDRNWFYCYGLAVSIATKYIPCMSECHMRQLLVESLQGVAMQLNVKLPTFDQCSVVI
ncbi:MAG: TetR/AcrR family transcriptional regulator [Clostridiales bacterium]|nr:TetR/AcrR family transcriptional regulator [Clostridiales bacterium]